MAAIFRHFWLLFPAIVWVNVAIAWRRVPERAAAGHGAPDEARRFLLQLGGAITALALALEALVLLAGWPSLTCLTDPAARGPAQAAGLAITVTSWVALLAWVWRGGGAERLARHGPLFARQFRADRTYSTGMVRLVVSLMVVGGAMSLALQSRPGVVPPAPPFGCALPAATR